MIANRTKTVTLTFKREELLYDLKNNAFVEGDVMRTDDEHARHQVFDICEDGNINRVTRMLDLAFARCVEFCYPYSKRVVPETTSKDDELEYTEEYVMELLVPDDFSQTTVDLLLRLIHEFLVASVLYDWLSITNTEKAVVWQSKAEETKELIRNNLNARVGRVRRTLNPF